MAYRAEVRGYGVRLLVLGRSRETEDEVMQHVATHASIAHPDLELTPDTVANIKSLIRTT